MNRSKKRLIFQMCVSLSEIVNKTEVYFNNVCNIFKVTQIKVATFPRLFLLQPLEWMHKPHSQILCEHKRKSYCVAVAATETRAIRQKLWIKNRIYYPEMQFGFLNCNWEMHLVLRVAYKPVILVAQQIGIPESDSNISKMVPMNVNIQMFT